MQATTANTLYVRAGLLPFARSIRRAGGVREFLSREFDFATLLAPHFTRARPFWERPRGPDPSFTTSGALGRQLANLPTALLSPHPTHAFVGVGPVAQAALSAHDHTQPCFYPLQHLAAVQDFSMLLTGCLKESPGFSTVHVAQYQLGLTCRHLWRHLLRWDYQIEGRACAITAPEVPGCSLSFHKFYPEYRKDGNLFEGLIDGQTYLFVPSARRALATELAILRENPRFVECGRPRCVTCRLRTY